MSVCYYNGIVLELIQTVNDERHDIYSEDTQDYLYTERTLTFMGIYNPAATSYALVPPLARRAVRRAGVVTDEAVRHYLSEPRKPLLYLIEDQANGAIVLNLDAALPAFRGNISCEVPFKFFTDNANAFRTDARGGPYPQGCRVMYQSGPKTFLVHWSVKVCVNECRNTSASAIQRVILSHRWRQRDDIGREHEHARVTEGTVVFRADELVKLGVVPDQFRQDLLHPIPENYQRFHISVTAESDGVTLHYVCADRERSHNLGLDSPATEIEAYQTDFANIPSFSGNVLKPFGASAPLGAVFGVFGVGNMLPSYYRSLFVRVWGNRDAARKDLCKLAMGIAAARITPLGLRFLFNREASLTQDLTGKFAEYQLTFRINPSLQSAFKRFQGASADQFLNDAAGLPETITVDGRPAVAIGNGANPRPPRSQGSRGTSPELVLAQMLGAACEVPSAPVNRQIGDRTFR